jgi:hypothetical protein
MPGSSRLFFLLDAPDDVRQRADQIASHWKGLITWHPDKRITDGSHRHPESEQQPAPAPADVPPERSSAADGRTTLVTVVPAKVGRSRDGITTQISYINRNDQEVIQPTGKPGTYHGQYVYVLRCRTCKHEYGANGSDVFQRRCPSHDRGAAGFTF